MIHAIMEEEEKTWPREVTIQPTEEIVRRELPANYDEDDEGSEALLYQKGWMRETIEIESWDNFEMPEGYEFVDDEDRENFEAYQKSKHKH